MYEELRKPPKQSVLFRFFQHAFGTQASHPDLSFPLLRRDGERKRRFRSAQGKSIKRPSPTIEDWSKDQLDILSHPVDFVSRHVPYQGLPPRLWPLVSTILRPWIYAPRSIGLRSTEHRPTLHGASAYAPRSIGLRSTLCQTALLAVRCRGGCNVYLRTAVFCFRWLIDPPLTPSP